jgi:solute carrier family 25 protein 34/35
MGRKTSSDFVLASSAACCACFFSNPFEVVKTRMQVQGELQAKNAALTVYRNPFQGLVLMIREEGLMSVYKGLHPGLWYQAVMNGVRIGGFPHVRAALADVPGGIVIAGATCGVVGAYLGQPFYLVKARMQAQSDSPLGSKIGVQHEKYSGMGHSLLSVVRQQGLVGLLRGWDASCMRVGIGSSIQLPVNQKLNESIVKNFPEYEEYRVTRTFVASCLASIPTVTALNPFDVLATRMANQAVDGSTYESSLECLRKTIKVEGISALQKGWQATWCRLGPHQTYVFVFMEIIKTQADRLNILQ